MEEEWRMRRRGEDGEGEEKSVWNLAVCFYIPSRLRNRQKINLFIFL